MYSSSVSAKLNCMALIFPGSNNHRKSKLRNSLQMAHKSSSKGSHPGVHPETARYKL